MKHFILALKILLKTLGVIIFPIVLFFAIHGLFSLTYAVFNSVKGVNFKDAFQTFWVVPGGSIFCTAVFCIFLFIGWIIEREIV
jgi:hypothetical protein